MAELVEMVGDGAGTCRVVADDAGERRVRRNPVYQDGAAAFRGQVQLLAGKDRRGDDDQRIYMTYHGVLYTPPAGQGERYWRAVPVFETASPKYDWLNRVVAVGVNYTVPQRIGYRIFQIL